MAKAQFKRRLWGYRRSAVDSHLAGIDRTIEELDAIISSRESDRADLVLRATRQTVEDVIADAQTRAAEIVAAAQARAELIAHGASVIDLRAEKERSEPA